GAVFGGAVFGGAVFGGAVFGGAVFGGAVFGGAVFGGAMLGAACSEDVMLGGSVFARRTGVSAGRIGVCGTGRGVEGALGSQEGRGIRDGARWDR
ncbi:pentapeptide repeat-containing protein, partial [Streptomyces sp. NPDC058469]|uniref:pentapeptide repeat-containing protein n=1 Tax=Streptomyces sp. NPDC058469 TaxID=3346514 RepID=UPI00364E659A